MRNYSKLNNTFAILFKNLKSLEKFIHNRDLCTEKRNELIFLAYIFRIGVIDKIEENPIWLTQNNIILIAKSFFKVKKYKLSEAIEIVTTKLNFLSSHNPDILKYIMGIIDRNEYFDEYDTKLSFSQKTKIYKDYA